VRSRSVLQKGLGGSVGRNKWVIDKRAIGEGNELGSAKKPRESPIWPCEGKESESLSNREGNLRKLEGELLKKAHQQVPASQRWATTDFRHQRLGAERSKNGEKRGD